MVPPASVDNILGALGHSDRVYQIHLWVDLKADPQWDKALATMQVPFPELTYLQLLSLSSEPLSVIPDTFLGGSAPRLQYLQSTYLISGNTETTFVCYSPHPASPYKYSSFWVHLT